MLLMLTTLAVLASTDVVDLVDPVRLLIMLLPEHLRGPAAVVLTTVAVTQAIASLIVARLPLSARQHPRYGGVVRALHWYSVLRLRDELGSTKLPGADVAPRVTVAPTQPPVEVLAEKAGAVAVSDTRGGFDPAARQTIAPDVVAVAQRITRESERGYVTLRALLAVVVLLAVAGVVATGCPRLPPVSGCNPMAQACIADRPHVCSASQRWQPAGDLACATVGGVCAVASGRAYCAPRTDGGAR